MTEHDTTHPNGFGAEPDMFDIAGFLSIFTGAVRHYRGIVIATCLLTVAAAIVYAKVWPPVYQVQAQVMAERDLDPQRDVFYSNWQVFRKADARDEIVLFTSGPVLRRVIEQNDLGYDDVYHPFMAHASYLWHESWLGQQYSAFKEWVAPAPEVAVDGEQVDGRVLDGLKAGVHIAGEQDSHIANITVKGPTPAVAQIANSLMAAYLEYRSEQFAMEARKAHAVLMDEAAGARTQLDEIAARREQFAKANGLLVEFQKEAQDVRELTVAESRIAVLESQIAAQEATIQQIETQIVNEPQSRVLSSTRELNPLRENAKLRLLELQTRLIDLRNRYREDSPEVVDAASEAEQLKAMIASEPEHIDRSVTTGVNANYQEQVAVRDRLLSEVAGARASLRSTRQSVAQLRSRLVTLPGLIDQATDLDREYGLAQEKYQRLLLRGMEAEVSATASSAAPASVRVVDYAVPPTSKSWPKMKYLLPGALLFGLGLGVVAAVLRSLTAGRLLQSHVDRGRIAAPVFATIATGNRRLPFTLVNGGRPSARALPEGRRRDDRSPSIEA